MVVEKMIHKASYSDVWCLGVVLLLGTFVYSIRGYLRAVMLAFKLDGPKALPIIGNCYCIKDRSWLIRESTGALERHGPVIRFWLLWFPYFAIIHPEDAQIILSSKKHTNKAYFYRLLHNFLGSGLITSSGEKWSTHRKLIQPIFTLSILEKFIGTFVDASQSLFQNIDPKLEEINISKYVNKCVLDLLNEAVLGVPIKKKATVDMGASPFRDGKVVVPDRILRPWLMFEKIYEMSKLAGDEISQKKRLNDFTRKMIKRRREIIENGEVIERKCLLDYLLGIQNDNPQFTEEDVIDEVCTFMLAGQDSVGAAIAFTLFLLAQNPDDQAKCHAEVEEIFGDDNRAPTVEDLKEMRYLEMCVKESLRLYPSVPLIARQLDEDVQLRKLTLPAGSNVLLCPLASHRLSEFYPNPEKFDPERFTPESSESRNPYAYIPFSAGPRYCIGNRFALMEMKTIISRLLRSYELLPVPGKTNLDVYFRVTLRATGGMWIKLKQKRLLTELAE